MYHYQLYLHWVLQRFCFTGMLPPHLSFVLPCTYNPIINSSRWKELFFNGKHSNKEKKQTDRTEHRCNNEDLPCEQRAVRERLEHNSGRFQRAKKEKIKFLSYMYIRFNCRFSLDKAFCRQRVIKMELVKTENALLFMFYQVFMENLITIHFPNLRQNVANFPNCKGGGGS